MVADDAEGGEALPEAEGEDEIIVTKMNLIEYYKKNEIFQNINKNKKIHDCE